MSPPGKSFVLLLVESNDDVAFVMRRMTTIAFPEAFVHRVATLDSAIDQLNQRVVSPRLILLSSYLRGSDGIMKDLWDFTSHPSVRSHPVLLLNYDDDPKNIQTYYQAGVSVYHVKPETYDEWQTLMGSIRNFWFLQARFPVS